MLVTVLAGGVGGARFLRGVLAALDIPLVPQLAAPDDADLPEAGPHDADPHDTGAVPGPRHEVRIIGNTGDDITLFGLRVCPDLDTVMYTLGGGIDDERGWGRAGETWAVREELAAYAAEPTWFALGDRDMATHILRTQLLESGYPLSAVTEALSVRWGLPSRGIHLLPMSDERIETHVVVDDPAVEGGQRALHFQEWWVRMQAKLPARRILAAGVDDARPGPGVIEAIHTADVVLLAPSNPVVSIGTILAVPGVRDALRTTDAPVVGVSPIIAGHPVRGMADAALAALGVPVTARAVAGLYRDFLDGWLVDTADAEDLRSGHLEGPGRADGAAQPVLRATPLLMTDVTAAQAIARAALDLAAELSRPGEPGPGAGS
jgi:LPPG:FO 2-phospho-L-lactate transferase